MQYIYQPATAKLFERRHYITGLHKRAARAAVAQATHFERLKPKRDNGGRAIDGKMIDKLAIAPEPPVLTDDDKKNLLEKEKAARDAN